MKGFLKFLLTLVALAAAFCVAMALVRRSEPEYIEIYSDDRDEAMPY